MMAKFQQVWMDEHTNYLIENASNMSDSQLVLDINLKFNTTFTKGAVRKKRQRLGIKKVGYRGHHRIIPNDIIEFGVP